MGIPFVALLLPLLAFSLIGAYYVVPGAVQERVKRFFDIEV